MATTTPEHSAATRCSIFIDSTTTTGWPARSSAPASTSTWTTVPCNGDAMTRSTIASV